MLSTDSLPKCLLQLRLGCAHSKESKPQSGFLTGEAGTPLTKPSPPASQAVLQKAVEDQVSGTVTRDAGTKVSDLILKSSGPSSCLTTPSLDSTPHISFSSISSLGACASLSALVILEGKWMTNGFLVFNFPDKTQVFLLHHHSVFHRFLKQSSVTTVLAQVP